MAKPKKIVQKLKKQATGNVPDGEAQSFRLLDLSAELRDQIYEYVLVSDISINIRSGKHSVKQYNTRPISSALLRTSRAVHAEAAPILYGRNSFRLSRHQALTTFTQKIGNNIRNLRKIKVSQVALSAEVHYIKVALEPAHMLTSLDIEMVPGMFMAPTRAEEIAGILGPLFRALHASQKKDTDRKARDVTEILHISGHIFRLQRDEELSERMRKFETRIKELIAATLK